MATVRLRDIVTEADRAAALALCVAPGQERFVASVERSFADAASYAVANPRSWILDDDGTAVGFMMIADGVSAEIRAAHWDDLIGPYFLWRLLIDARHQRRGYGSAALDALVAYVRGRPGGDILYVSCEQGEGSPQPFYERYGFTDTGHMVQGEILLSLALT